MQTLLKLKVTALVAIGLFMAQPALADDLLITGTISDTQTYDSAEGIIFENAVATPTANITAIAANKIVLKPGTRFEAGAYFAAQNNDHDGLPNSWEMDHCQTLDHSPDDDPDGDGLTMSDELQNNTNPCNADSDDDGMSDSWELQYGLNPLSKDANGDLDGDGFSNYSEYLRTDPTDAQSIPLYFSLQYDENGNLLEMVRP